MLRKADPVADLNYADMTDFDDVARGFIGTLDDPVIAAQRYGPFRGDGVFQWAVRMGEHRHVRQRAAAASRQTT